METSMWTKRNLIDGLDPDTDYWIDVRARKQCGETVAHRHSILETWQPVRMRRKL